MSMELDMDVEIVSVQGSGNAAKEHVVLKVLNDCNLKNYMLADTTYVGASGNISNKSRHTFWWYPHDVKKGELVLLHTGIGKDTQVVHSGIRVHVFFWNLKSAVWNDTGDAALLFNVADWRTKKVG